MLGVGRIDYQRLPEMPHPLGTLGAREVALPGTSPHEFSRRSHLEALRGAAMRLEFPFDFPWLCHNSL
jgi:hypothetical protein